MSKIILIGCGKSKTEYASVAYSLYTGPLFKARQIYAENNSGKYMILSAKYGLLSPYRVVEPYDQTLSELSPLDQIAWAVGVVTQICEEIDNNDLTFRQLRDVHFEIHAGEDYSGRLIDLLVAAGFSASWPVRGLAQGEQLRWYKERRPLPLKD